jgi:hypothetical protein
MKCCVVNSAAIREFPIANTFEVAGTSFRYGVELKFITITRPHGMIERSAELD